MTDRLGVSRETREPAVAPVEPAIRRLDAGATAFFPEGYEPRYAYPLLVLLNGRHPDHDFRSWMRGVSSRNYLGLQLRADTEFDTVLERVRESVARLRRSCNVHTERIFVLGGGEYADVGLRTFFARPEWFGGAALLADRGPDFPPIPFRNQHVRGKRVFLGSANAETANGCRTFRRSLHAAGLDAVHRRCAVDPAAAFGRELNVWLMRELCGAA